MGPKYKFNPFFTVHATAGVILEEGSKATVVITKNDDPHGLVAFEGRPNHEPYIFYEDSGKSYNIAVLRTKGRVDIIARN